MCNGLCNEIKVDFYRDMLVGVQKQPMIKREFDSRAITRESRESRLL